MARRGERYHALQVATFADTAVDVVTALTMTYAEEATGIVARRRAAGLPSAISFTVETDGRLPSGQPLGEAIEQVDAETGGAPAYFMVNCAHPTHFAHVLERRAVARADPRHARERVQRRATPSSTRRRTSTRAIRRARRAGTATLRARPARRSPSSAGAAAPTTGTSRRWRARPPEPSVAELARGAGGAVEGELRRGDDVGVVDAEGQPAVRVSRGHSGRTRCTRTGGAPGCRARTGPPRPPTQRRPERRPGLGEPA